MRRSIAAATALAAVLPSTTWAADERVEVSYLVRQVRHGEGVIVVVECDATAVSGSSGFAPVGTTVWCMLDGHREERTIPGPRSAVVFPAAALPDPVLCYGATATFVGSGTSRTVTTGPTCVAP